MYATEMRRRSCTLQVRTFREHSLREIPVGADLKDKYDPTHNGRLRLEVRGQPTWDGKPGRLKPYFGEIDATFSHPTCQFRQFSTGLTTSRRRGCAGDRRQDPRRLSDHHRQDGSIRRSRAVRTVSTGDGRARRVGAAAEAAGRHGQGAPYGLGARAASAISSLAVSATSSVRWTPHPLGGVPDRFTHEPCRDADLDGVPTECPDRAVQGSPAGSGIAFSSGTGSDRTGNVRQSDDHR